MAKRRLFKNPFTPRQRINRHNLSQRCCATAAIPNVLNQYSGRRGEAEMDRTGTGRESRQSLTKFIMIASAPRCVEYNSVKTQSTKQRSLSLPLISVSFRYHYCFIIEVITAIIVSTVAPMSPTSDNSRLTPTNQGVNSLTSVSIPIPPPCYLLQF